MIKLLQCDEKFNNIRNPDYLTLFRGGITVASQTIYLCEKSVLTFSVKDSFKTEWNLSLVFLEEGAICMEVTY